MQEFKTQVDAWIKDLDARLKFIEENQVPLQELAQEINHNYDLIQELRANLSMQKEELQAMRLIQMLHLKDEIRKDNSKPTTSLPRRDTNLRKRTQQ